MRESEKKTSLIITLIKGALAGVAVSLLLILVMSLALDWEWMELKNVQAFTWIAKLLSSLAAAALAVRLYRAKALLTGALAGACYAAFAYLTFSIISGRFLLSWGVLGDIGVGLLCGGVMALFMKVVRI